MGLSQAQEGCSYLRVRRAQATLEVLVLYRAVAPGEGPLVWLSANTVPQAVWISSLMLEEHSACSRGHLNLGRLPFSGI